MGEETIMIEEKRSFFCEEQKKRLLFLEHRKQKAMGRLLIKIIRANAKTNGHLSEKD
jgi:hypothetical protein